MTVVAAETSPLNCRWISWNHTLPVCTRPSAQGRQVSEVECSMCEFWREDDGHWPTRRQARGAEAHPKAPMTRNHGPLRDETCPQCGSHDVVLKQRDAVVQSFVCSICHQQWLATQPWPLLRDTRSHPSEP